MFSSSEKFARTPPAAFEGNGFPCSTINSIASNVAPLGLPSSVLKKPVEDLTNEFKKLRKDKDKMFFLKEIMEIDKFDKSDLTPDILDLHISFAMKWYLMDIEMNNHQKQTRRLVEEIKAEQKQIVIRK